MTHTFLKIDGVPGTGTGVRKDWLQALSVTIPATRRHSEVHVTRILDAASPTLFRLFSEGRNLATVIIEVEANGKAIWKAELTDVLIAGMHVSQHHPPTEDINFNYVTAKFEVADAAASQPAAGGGRGANVARP
jgi:type VI protein secretion system component Hcp